MTDTPKTEAEVLLDAGLERSPIERVQPDGDLAPIARLPDGARIVDLEKFLPAPLRKRGTALFRHEKGFAAYVNDHKDKASRIFADVDELTMEAVLDLHVPSSDGAGARWGQHRARFAPPQDPDFVRWRKFDENKMSQVDFAQFIEDMLPTIANPDGAEVLEVAQHLEAKSAVTFKSAERLTDGQRALHYEEEVQGRVGKGNIEIPDLLTLRLPVFRRGDPVEMRARLRYRIAQGGLVLWYHLDRPHEVVDDAFQRLIDGVDVETQLPVLIGEPPKAGR